MPRVFLLLFILLSVILLGFKKDSSTNLEYKGAVLAHIHRFGSGYGSKPSQVMHSHLKDVGYDTIQLNTFAYIKDRRQTKIFFDGDPTMADKFVEKEIRNLHQSGFKVMLKPHIWIGGWRFDSDNWRSKIDFSDLKKREDWFLNYTNFILSQARLAERNHVEVFVVGTELVGLSKYSDDWIKLIRKVRGVYGGKITYAAEGMNVKDIGFWFDLDYIGIDVYLPLAKHNNPTIKELVQGWQQYEPEIQKLAEKYNKKILFTEVGYKSVEGSAIRPWEWNRYGKVSQEEQAKAYEAAFKVFKNKPYLAGIFIWKYFTDMNSYEKPNVEKGFTPYGKKAERVISGWFNRLD